MNTRAESRRTRLGEVACARAREVADAAPNLTPAQRDALAVLMRTTRKTKAATKAA